MDGLIAWGVKLAGEKSGWLRVGMGTLAKMPVMDGRFLIKYLEALATKRTRRLP